MKITPNGTNPTRTGPADWFTGMVSLDTPFAAGEPAGFSGAVVSFTAGARTNWHTHPKGQLIIVTSGLGWAQSDGGEIHEIRPGDVVWFEPGERHWHGATDRTSMAHVAIAEAENGSVVDWAEPVSDEDYLRSV
ncbi:cupin domain-containing protein [Roseibium sp.]|uniref:(R)-mandelonitrile lyase n=1 Tax=Roseibium sp. TaxID=1936156 RepID=UPI003A96D0DA